MGTFSSMRKMNIVQTVFSSVRLPRDYDESPGAVAADVDGDGRLDLIVSHGESAAQPLSVYKVNQVRV